MTGSLSTSSSIGHTATPQPHFLRKWMLDNPRVASCGNHDHFAIIYDSPDEQLDFIVPFLRLGLERGEKAVFIYDDNSAETVIEAMEQHGIDVAAASRTGALAIITKSHAYLKNGDFDPDWMIDFLAQAVTDAKRQGFAAVRASGEMTWALGPAGNTHDRLIEYECKLNKFFPTHDMGGICQYNRRRFRPQTLMHVIHTHSRIVFRGELCDNPYYIPPDLWQTNRDGIADAVLRLLKSMAENTRLRRELAAESEALRRAEMRVFSAQMASILAHEINNPLEAITNFHFLLQQENLPESARNHLERMGEELRRVCDISERTLEFFRSADLPEPEILESHC